MGTQNSVSPAASPKADILNYFFMPQSKFSAVNLLDLKIGPP